MKNFSGFKKQAQRGFTLIEILVALSILSVIALLASTAFDGSRSKAQAMIGLAKQVGDANIMLKTDTGCYVDNPNALFDSVVAQLPANNYCGRVFGNTWSRNYLGQYTVNGVGDIVADKISAGVTLGFGVEASGVGSGKRYFVKVSNVPTDILKQALMECNNSTTVDDKGDLAKNRCRTSPATDLSGDAPGDFDMLYDTTR